MGITQILSTNLDIPGHIGGSGSWHTPPLKTPSMHCGPLAEMQTRPLKVDPAGHLGPSWWEQLLLCSSKSKPAGQDGLCF